MDTKLYGEYVCGASTEWVLADTSANILSVDTCKVWLKAIKKT